MTAVATDRSEHIARARLRKAQRIVAVLKATGATEADLTPEVWDAAILAAGTNPPSLATRTLVVDLLVADPDTDPF